MAQSSARAQELGEAGQINLALHMRTAAGHGPRFSRSLNLATSFTLELLKCLLCACTCEVRALYPPPSDHPFPPPSAHHAAGTGLSSQPQEAIYSSPWSPTKRAGRACTLLALHTGANPMVGLGQGPCGRKRAFSEAVSHENTEL